MKWTPKMTGIAALVFLFSQVALPLAYYADENVYDERFAWRMFSSVRMTNCKFQLSSRTASGLTPLPLAKEYHVVWLNLAKRARIDVVNSMIDRACETHEHIEGMLQCTTAASPAIGLCRNARDGDADLIPDGYQSLVGCNDLNASLCFKRDCPSGNVAECTARLCRRELLPRSKNLCTKALDP